jgi:hypothetical protein
LERRIRGGRRASAVIDAEAGRHDDEERADVPEPELEPEKTGVTGGIAVERRYRAEVGGVVDDRDLHALASAVGRARDAVERLAGRSRGRLRGEIDVLEEQLVARGISIRQRRRCCRGRGREGHGRGERDGRRAAAHLVQLVGCGLSTRSAVVGVPPGTTNVTITTAGSLLSFLTVNIFAAVS